VIEPKLVGGISGKHIKYTIRGKDDLSPFTCDRRYKEFLVLRRRLVDQWPGCFIPAIPPKQALGNKTQQFIEKRRKLLHEFARKAAATSHIYHSDEFQTFLRGPPNFHKLRLAKITSALIYEKYSTSLASYA
jgi:hypothetical protein